MVHLIQWCTTSFDQGPLIDISNPSGARQVRRLPFRPMIQKLKFMLIFMSCAVKHKVNIKSYREWGSCYVYIIAMLKLYPMTTVANEELTLNLKWHTSLILQQLTDLDSKVKSKNQLYYHPVNHALAFKTQSKVFQKRAGPGNLIHFITFTAIDSL